MRMLTERRERLVIKKEDFWKQVFSTQTLFFLFNNLTLLVSWQSLTKGFWNSNQVKVRRCQNQLLKKWRSYSSSYLHQRGKKEPDFSFSQGWKGSWEYQLQKDSDSIKHATTVNHLTRQCSRWNACAQLPVFERSKVKWFRTRQVRS